jgi:hypothetical protein
MSTMTARATVGGLGRHRPPTARRMSTETRIIVPIGAYEKRARLTPGPPLTLGQLRCRGCGRARHGPIGPQTKPARHHHNQADARACESPTFPQGSASLWLRFGCWASAGDRLADVRFG